jgi:4-hydroxy-tetrahydrodipicolinate reductase
MGRTIAQMVAADPAVTLAGRFARPGVEAAGLVAMDTALAAADVVIDFTTGAASAALAEQCAARGGPALVIGATGFAPADLDRIAAAARRVAIVRAGNFSLGVNLLMGLVARLARTLPAESWDIEIAETHHRRKVDAPSGTALMLGEAAAAGRGVPLAAVERRARDGLTGERPVGEIGFAVRRGGDVVGEHSMLFAGAAESLTLSHVAHDRGMFAHGAVIAARWVAGRAPGAYDMRDVLGFADPV